MTSKHELKNLISDLSMLKVLTQTYQQIAASHIRKTRTSVVLNRDFITELLQLFEDVRRAYKDELKGLMKKNKIKHTKNLSLIKRNGKTTVVFIAANTGLYGGIVKKTAVLVSEYLKKNDAEVTIVGKNGEQLFRELNPGKNYTVFDFPDNTIDSIKLSELATHLIQYEKVLVFYSQFQSIVSQNPTISTLDSSVAFEQGEEEKVKKYLFEPSLEQIIVFFESEVFGLIFEQTVREAQLAKQASRMYALDVAIQNINKSLTSTQQQSNILHHRTINTKQINSLSGMGIWA